MDSNSTQPKDAPGGSESSEKQAERLGEASVDAPDTKKTKLDGNSGKVKTQSGKKMVTKNVNNRILALKQKRRGPVVEKAHLELDVERLRQQMEMKQEELKKKVEEIPELDELRRFEHSHLEELLGFKVEDTETIKTPKAVTLNMQSEAAEQKGARGEVATTSVTAQADPSLDQDSRSAEDVFPLMPLFDVAQGRIFKNVYDYLPQRDQKALSEANKRLFERYRKDWLGHERTWIHAKLRNSADVEGFCDLMGNPALGPFDELNLYLHCELGREFAVGTDDNVHRLTCVFQLSYWDTLSKLSAAFPAVTHLIVERMMGTEPFAGSGTDLSLSWNLSYLCVRDLPVSMFTTCSSNLTELCYRLCDVPRDAINAIPSALFDACKDTLVELHVYGNGSSFEVCRMDDVVKLTKVRKFCLCWGASIANLDMNRIPPTLTTLWNGDQPLI